MFDLLKGFAGGFNPHSASREEAACRLPSHGSRASGPAGPDPGRRSASPWPWRAEPFRHVVIVDGKVTGADQWALPATIAGLAQKPWECQMVITRCPLISANWAASARASGEIFQRDGLPSCRSSQTLAASTVTMRVVVPGRGSGNRTYLPRTAPPVSDVPASRVRCAMSVPCGD